MQIIHIFVLFIISQSSVFFAERYRPGLSYTPLQLEVLQRLIGFDLCGQFTAQ